MAMTVRELRAALQSIEEKHGDLPVLAAIGFHGQDEVGFDGHAIEVVLNAPIETVVGTETRDGTPVVILSRRLPEQPPQTPQ